MATGSGTGTPATGAGAATLATLRARVLTQITGSSQTIDWTPVATSALTLTTMRDRVEILLQASGHSYATAQDPMTASSLTLATLRDRVELVLQDTGNATWATGDIDEAVDQALEMYSRVKPDHAISTITLSADGREVDISTLTGLLRVEKVWVPYDSTAPSFPPNWVKFETWPGSLLYIDDTDEPQDTEKVRIWYTKEHTIDGLGGAGATTIPKDDEAFIIQGTAALCARMRAVEIAEQANVDSAVYDRLMSWGDQAMTEYDDGLKKREQTRTATYDQDMVDEAIRQAIEQYSRRRPNHAIHDLTLSADGREIDISGISDLIRVERVWWDYDSSSPGHPPNWRHFETWPGSIVYINDPTAPSSGDHVRIWYTKEHTVNGLDSESTTTIPIDDESFLIHGAAAFAARFRAARHTGPTHNTLMSWAQKAMSEFMEGLYRRYSRGKVMDYDQDDLDEAVRWALHRYNEILPDRTVTTLTLSADGREIDVSSITDYHTIEQIWLDYDSSDPEYPPRWADCQLWPGDILYVDAGNEPQSGDVVRIWYTRLHTINGLDSASATSLPTNHDTLIVTGAGGCAAQERIQDEESRYVPRKLREWAQARLREFERGLKQLAREEGIEHSGIAEGPALDRWEGEWA